MLSKLSLSRRACLLFSTIAIMALPSIATATQVNFEESFNNKAATGVELANAFFEMLEVAGSKGAESKAFAKPYLDSAFLLQRASGKRYLVDTYVPPLIESFEVGDVRETRPADDVMVVRYSVRTDETAPDTALIMSKEKAPRITVFHWDAADRRWKVVSHANFNIPVAAVCDKQAIVQEALTSPVTSADYVLGLEVVNDFISLLEAGDAAPIVHPLYQVQTASGAGLTTLAERKKPSKVDDMTFKDPVVTRNGHLMVFSGYFETTQHTFMNVNQLRVGMVPHLLTFLEVEGGKWKMVANALFSPPATLPEGVACITKHKLEMAP